MKYFVVALFLAAVVALATGGAVLNIPGYDQSVVGYASDDAPLCTNDNYYCLIPDDKDATVFYRCVTLGLKTVKHQCNEGRNFIFGGQLCGMPGEWCAPQAPFKCADMEKACK